MRVMSTTLKTLSGPLSSINLTNLVPGRNAYRKSTLTNNAPMRLSHARKNSES